MKIELIVRTIQRASVTILVLGLCCTGSLWAAQELSSEKTSSGADAQATPAANIPSQPNVKDSPKKPRDEKSALPGDSATERDRDVYRIGVEDALQIDVWKEPELSMAVVVRPDGVVSLPLVNDLRVVGLTTKELQDLLAEKLKAYVNEPQVTVIVREIRSRKVYLVGQVGHPGPYLLNGRKTVLQLLGEGGGLAQFAKAGSIYVLRRNGADTTRIRFNYKKALSGRDPKADFELLPNDMVVVP